MARTDKTDVAGLKDALADVKDQLMQIEGNFESRIRDKAIEARQKAENKVRQHHLQSVGVAFGTGILAGWILTELKHRK